MNPFTAIVVACILAIVAAECPSACSGHGTCGAYDACSCFRNWMSNDCSERICPFGLAHVDTPMGDLDASAGQLTDVDTNVIVNDAMYPGGTTEQFPAMKDSAGSVLTDSAHYYRECSNKGICDRSSGECECFEGYDGSSCQRASCPSSANGVCSGHGTCKTIQELAGDDNENIYRLWDEDITMGCDCDAGYDGADCSSRTCKVGVDPLYVDDYQNARHANYTLQFYIMNDDAEIYGNYSLVFTDVYGEDWQTEPIDIDANCATIQDRLESIPNDVIPYGSVKCYKSEETLHYQSQTTGINYSAANGGQTNTLGGNQNNVNANGQDATENVYGANQHSTEATTAGELIYSAFNYSVVNKFILAFPGNPGEIAPPKVNRYLDGKRATLFSTERGLQTLGVHIYANGFHGETTDYVNDECEGVLVGLASDQVKSTDQSGEVNDGEEKLTHYLSIDDNIQFENLKRCLGDSDGVTTNNVEVYDWDYGNFMNPHLIKLVDATQDRFTEYLRADGSSYKVLNDVSGDGIGNEHQYKTGVGHAWEHLPWTKLCNRGKAWNHDNSETSPIHKLLFQADISDSSGSGGGVFNRGTHGWCKNPDPAGFYAIIYFDDCTANGVSMVTSAAGTSQVLTAAANTDSAAGVGVAGVEMCSTNRKGFRVLTRPALDYSTTTKFHVYTTKGTMQQVSQHSAAYTASMDEKMLSHDGLQTFGLLNPDFVHGFHSNVIHLQNTSYTGANGQVDCETAYDFTTNTGKYGNLDCLNKGDKIFLVNLGERNAESCEGSRSYKNIAGQTVGTGDSCYYKSTAASFDSNPRYPNMYTVQKIGKIAKNPNAMDHADTFYKRDGSIDRRPEHSALNSEGYRHQITLNMGVNTQYMGMEDSRGAMSSGSRPAIFDTKATIYKFHPPALNSTASTGYNYVGACSNRGICNGDDGLCECFEGYTGDDCGKINSLAQ